MRGAADFEDFQDALPLLVLQRFRRITTLLGTNFSTL